MMVNQTIMDLEVMVEIMVKAVMMNQIIVNLEIIVEIMVEVVMVNQRIDLINISQLQLTHIKVAFLSSNTISHLQPLNIRIIASFKNYYKRNFCHHMLNLFEDRKDINKEKINIKEAIDYLVDV